MVHLNIFRVKAFHLWRSVQLSIIWRDTCRSILNVNRLIKTCLWQNIFERGVELSPLIFIHIINGGILSLTDSHHHHRGQIPTMVGICHSGNRPMGYNYNDIQIWIIMTTFFIWQVPLPQGFLQRTAWALKGSQVSSSCEAHFVFHFFARVWKTSLYLKGSPWATFLFPFSSFKTVILCFSVKSWIT